MNATTRRSVWVFIAKLASYESFRPKALSILQVTHRTATQGFERHLAIADSPFVGFSRVSDIARLGNRLEDRRNQVSDSDLR